MAETVLKLCTKVASATFLLALMLASGANAEGRLPPCPKDRRVSWDNCHGTFTWPDGRKYVGEFKDGKANGQGTLTSPDGRKYVGEWKDDLLNGQGTYTWPNGQKYVGEWKDNKPVAPSAENSSNKATTSVLGLPERTDGYLPLILLAIAAIAAIAGIFLMKDRTEPSIRVFSPPVAKNPRAKSDYYRGVLKMYSYHVKVLYVAASVIALMLIFPPIGKFAGYPMTRVSAGYDFIFSLPQGVFVNIQVLLIQWLGVALVAGTVYFAASKKQ